MNSENIKTDIFELSRGGDLWDTLCYYFIRETSAVTLLLDKS